MMKIPCPSSGCRRVFRTSVALTFHLKAEHPAGLDENRALLRQARRREQAENRANAEERSRKQIESFCRRYHSDRPCGLRAKATGEGARG